MYGIVMGIHIEPTIHQNIFQLELLATVFILCPNLFSIKSHNNFSTFSNEHTSRFKYNVQLIVNVHQIYWERTIKVNSNLVLLSFFLINFCLKLLSCVKHVCMCQTLCVDEQCMRKKNQLLLMLWRWMCALRTEPLWSWCWWANDQIESNKSQKCTFRSKESERNSSNRTNCVVIIVNKHVDSWF